MDPPSVCLSIPTTKRGYAQVTSVHYWTLADKQDRNMLDSKQISKTAQGGSTIALARNKTS